jgi:hypothetical protein
MWDGIRYARKNGHFRASDIVMDVVENDSAGTIVYFRGIRNGPILEIIEIRKLERCHPSDNESNGEQAECN